MRGSFTRRHRGTVGHEAEPTQGVRRSTCDRHAEVLLDEVRELVVGADHDILHVRHRTVLVHEDHPGSPRTLNGTRTCAPGSATSG